MLKDCTATQIKQIRALLVELPDAKYLEQNLTDDQLKFWVGQRQVNQLITRRLRELDSETGNSLSSLQEELDPSTYTLCCLSALSYRRLWELIVFSESSLKKVAGQIGLEYPFTSALELFAHLVRTASDAHFKTCLQPYIELSAPKHEAIRRRVSKALKKPQGFQKPKVCLSKIPYYYAQGKYYDFWGRYLCCVCEVLAHSQQEIKTAFRDYKAVLADAMEVHAKILHESTSIAWKKGRKGTGQRGGFYAFPEAGSERKSFLSDLNPDSEDYFS